MKKRENKCYALSHHYFFNSLITIGSDYVDSFLANYRSFMGPKHLLDLFIEWYNVINYPNATADMELFLKKHKKAIQSRCIKIILHWITTHWQDFATDKVLLDKLMKFIEKTSSTSFGDGQKLNQACREQVRKKEKKEESSYLNLFQ